MPPTLHRARTRVLTCLLALIWMLGLLGWGINSTAGSGACAVECPNHVSALPLAVDPRPRLELPAGGRIASARRVVPQATDVMTLHSRPGSKHTVFLDFDGADLSRTMWATAAPPGTPAVVSRPDLDGRPGVSSMEWGIIELVWRQVAEDFAPFDVDVTTQAPAGWALSRPHASDLVFGTTVVFAPDGWAQSACGTCSGAAYVGSFATPGADAWRTALVFPDFLSRRVPAVDPGVMAQIIGTTASHEIGHQLGLHHDGLTRRSPWGAMTYNPGTPPWGPIMGASSNPLTQWAGPGTPHTDNVEDDVALIESVLGPVPDEEPPLRPLRPGDRVFGVITTARDEDSFAILPSRPTRVTVGPSGPWGNLDVALEVTAGQQRPRSIAPVARSIGGRVVGLDASVLLSPGVVYTLTVRADSTPGAGTYGSLGTYLVEVSGSSTG